jgi:F-type H+-transporting ATPase subunit delta
LITNAIARRYAKALVQLGAEEKSVDRFQTELASLEAVLDASAELRSVIANPAYGIEAKRGIIGELTAKLALSTTVANFMLLLLDKNRLDQLPQIVLSYGNFADELSGVVRPTLTTPLPLDAKQVEGIKNALAQVTGRQVVLKVEHDPTLIGGVVTKIGDKVFDGSVRTQLTMIQDTLQKG